MSYTRLIIFLTFCFVIPISVGPVSATEVKALVTIAMKSVIDDLAPKFEMKTGNKITAIYALSNVMADRVQNGEQADYVISTRRGIDNLLKSGRVIPGSDLTLIRSSIGVAVRKGEPHPDLSTPEALKTAILASRMISYSNPAAGGPSGVHFASVMEGFGIAEQMKSKTKFPPSGGFVGELLVSREVDLAIQQMAELKTIPGVDVVGPLPKELQSVTVYAGAVPTVAKEPEAARAFQEFLRSPEAVDVIIAKGNEPG